MPRTECVCVPLSDPFTGRPETAVSGGRMLRWPFRNRDAWSVRKMRPEGRRCADVLMASSRRSPGMLGEANQTLDNPANMSDREQIRPFAVWQHVMHILVTR